MGGWGPSLDGQGMQPPSPKGLCRVAGRACLAAWAAAATWLFVVCACLLVTPLPIRQDALQDQLLLAHGQECVRTRRAFKRVIGRQSSSRVMTHVDQLTACTSHLALILTEASWTFVAGPATS